MDQHKKIEKEEKYKNLQLEKQMIKETVLNVNSKVSDYKSQVMSELIDNKTLTNPNIIKRIGK